ncbi:MAG: hypothetical protein ACK5MV_00695 [Aminipila sp.]
MNPIVVFALFMLLYQENNHFPNHFETFKLEKLLDKLNYTVESLDRINHLNELAHEPFVKGNIAHTIEDSIHTVKPLFPEGRSQQHLDTVESIVNSIKKVGNLQNMAQSLGPMLSMLNNLPSSSNEPEQIQNNYTDNSDNNYKDDYRDNYKEDYRNNYKNNFEDDYRENNRNDYIDNYSDDFRNNQRNDSRDDFRNNQRNDFRNDSRSNQRNDFRDDYENNQRNDFRDDFENNQRNDFRNDFENNQRNDFRNHYKDNYKDDYDGFDYAAKAYDYASRQREGR